MNVIDAPQGSPEWLAIRAKHFTASEAPAMLGLSKYKTRQELLREKATGLTEEVDANKQRLFDRGHEAEAVARPLAESYLQEDLFPATGAAEIDGLPLLASFDGLTMDESVVWENKLENASLIAMLASGDLDGTYWPQVEQQLLVSGASRALFTICDGEQITDKFWYESKPERRAQIIAGWKQFAEDLAGYRHVEAAPVVTAAPIRELPALTVEIAGAVTASNLAQWKEIVTERIAGINTDLHTDQDFADADSMVKFLDEGEKKIDLVKSQAQASAADIDRVFRALDEIKASMRAKRLELDKLVTKRKESIKVEIMQAGKDELAKHIAGLNKRLAKVQMPAIAADFATAIKGKRNLESMRGAVADLVAAKKIESNEIADKIDANLKTIVAETEYHFLFSDVAMLSMKQPDDLALIIRTRIVDHKREEERRAELAREKIRVEEERKAAAKVKAEQEEAERQRKAAEEAAAQIERDRRQKIVDDTASIVLSEKSVADANARAFVDAMDPAAKPAPRTFTTAINPARVAEKPSRPSDAMIIGILSAHYRVHESKVVEWLLDMDLKAASDSLMKEFAA
jgi:predicted phage-related endonuclease